METVSVDEKEAESSRSHYKERGLFKMETQAQVHHHRPQKVEAPASCMSLNSDRSMDRPPYFSEEPRGTHSKGLLDDNHRIEAPVSCVSLNSDRSMDRPPYFSEEPRGTHSNGLLDTPADGPVSCCLCGNIPSDPVSTSCRHCFCRECFSLNWDQLGSPHICPHCGQRLNIHSSLQSDHKKSLMERCGSVSEGSETGSGTALNRIYTELYITEGLSEEGSTQHEESQLETHFKTVHCDTPIRVHDIFKALPTEHHKEKSVRVVLTSGVAGVGKTFSVLKFILDWAQALENQDVDVVLPLSFRELNLIREESYSLLKLIHVFHPSLQKLTAETLVHCKILFVFDGLDESRLTLNFLKCAVISEVTQTSKVNLLLVNLIKGSLLPSALIWITSRPAAANQIPARCVHRVTEVRGFITEQQKEQYFRKRFTDEEQCHTVLSHIRTSRSLHIMCVIPVFCLITATVLDHILRTSDGGALPQTLTDMYAHFLLVQTHRKSKYRQETSGPGLTQADCEVLLKLGRLAFEHLLKGNIMFYQEDLQQVGLEEQDVLVYLGLCTEIFKQENVIFKKSVYCFVHLSVQEFLAAVYRHYCLNNRKNTNLETFLQVWNHTTTIDIFLKKTLKQSLKSKNGHLDLFVRFLHGLSLDSNRRLLGALLGPTQIDSQTRQRIIKNLKDINTDKISPDRSINIFHCLTELNDHSIHQQIQAFLRSENRSEVLSEIHCSALAYMLQMSGEVLEVLDLKKYKTTAQGRLRLIPAVRNCRKALLSEYGLSSIHCEVITLALQANPSHLRELDLSKNEQINSLLKMLCGGLASPHCQLETLRLKDCNLPESSCASLASALKSNPSHLRELDLRNNTNLKDTGMKHLCGFLESPDCQLDTLRMSSCGLTETSCSYLASALMTNPSHLKELYLGWNLKMRDPGLEHLCKFLASPDCRLKTLGLNWCGLAESGCSALALAKPSHLTYLDLGGNCDIKDSAVQHLCGFLQNPICLLEILRLNSCGVSKSGCSSLAAALKSNRSSHLTELNLWYNFLNDSDLRGLIELTNSPLYRLKTLLR